MSEQDDTRAKILSRTDRTGEHWLWTARKAAA